MSVTVDELSLVTLKPADSEPLEDARLLPAVFSGAFEPADVDRAADALEDAALGARDDLFDLEPAVAELPSGASAVEAARGLDTTVRPDINC